MKVIVNGKEKELKNNALLKDAIKDEPYVPGSSISIHISTEKLTTKSNDFELFTNSGSMILHLDDSKDAKVWRSKASVIEGVTIRWVTNDIVAFGSFKTDIELDKTERRYKPYDCFFSLGGFDNQTTYVMIARKDHKRTYGTGSGRIGKITIGRHILNLLKEGEAIISIKPVIFETNKENVKITSDLNLPVEEGNKIDTRITVKLKDESPKSSEQVFIISSKGYINVTDSTGSFIGSQDNIDIEFPEEAQEIRRTGSIAIRNKGLGSGKVLLYKETRQPSSSHNVAGIIENGMGLISHASIGDKITIITDPLRIMSIGMTQAKGSEFLSGIKIKQVKTGDTSDDAVIVKQIPEMTMEIIKEGKIETFGVPKENVFLISLLSNINPLSTQYFRRLTGLDNKPIGSLKTQFSFPGIPMITFYGDDEKSKFLYPHDPFKKCKQGDIGLTNQSRPHHGLVGIRLEDSKEFGPTGEEPYGTNIIGKFLGDISKLSEIEEDEEIYIMEDKI